MWSTRVGAEVMKPLATPVLGGMVSSLFHVLIVTPVIFFWVRERRLGLHHELVPRDAPVAAGRPRLWGGVAVAALVLVGSVAIWRVNARDGQQAGDANAARVLQTVPAGDLEIVLMAPTGTLQRGRNAFTVEFHRAGTQTRVDVGRVQGSAHMSMPGMAMSGEMEIGATGVPGRYSATAEFGMAGAWRFAIDWDGPAGRGSVTFEGSVQ
jgi:Cu(I)/Ag(I) efflux system membrane protein CusA/SilA